MDTSVVTPDGTRAARRPPPVLGAAGYACAGSLTAVAVALGASAETDVPLVSGLLRGTIVAAPFAAAAYAFREPRFARFGRLLLVVGLASFLSCFGESADATLYTIGRLSGWCAEALLVLLVLAFPTGRLETRIDRSLAAGAFAVVAFLILSAGLTPSPFPVPSPWTSCTQDCLTNAFAVVDHDVLSFNPLAVAGVMVFTVLLGLVVRLQQRCEAATGLRRQILLPLLWVSMLRAALVGCGFVWRVVEPDSAAVEACSWLIAVLTPLVSVAFLLGLVRERAFTENDPVREAPHASPPLDASALQRELAAIALENQRLEADAASANRELRRSRARIAAAADLERRRIERDLHDGAQQRLVALRIELGLVEELVHEDPARSVTRLRELGESVDAALEDLRALAHGVRPPLLEDRGLAEALPAAAAAAALPVRVRLTNVCRYPPEVESAVYFCALEALQNVAKHAHGATHADLIVTGGEHRLRFCVRDDGAGAPDGRLVAGMGLTNMADRLAAVGGWVTVTSKPGLGTAVRGEVPLTA